MEGFLGGLLGFVAAPWMLVPFALIAVCVLAIIVHIFHSAGSAVERRVTRALDDRESRRN